MSSPVDSTEPSDEDEEGKLYGCSSFQRFPQFSPGVLPGNELVKSLLLRVLFADIYELREEECETDRTQISSSPKQSPVHLEIPAERRTHTAGAPKVCTLKKVQGIKKSVQTKEPLQKKPWNQPNANVSDYFNYGFTEETWKAYYKKQTKLQAFKRSQKLKIMAQKTRDGVKAEKSVSSENSSSGKPSTVASRKSEANGGMRKGLTRCRSRKTSSPCYRAYNAQDICDSSHEKSVFPFYDKPLGASTTIFPSVSPSSFLFQPRSGYGSSFCMSTLSRQADGSDVPVKPLFQCSSGNSTQLAESIKGWNRHIRERKHDRSREHDLDRESIREKNREKHSSSSSSHRRRSSTTRSQKYSRVKEQKKARSSKDENHRCCSSKDILGENRRKDRSWKPDRVSYSSSQKSCREKNEDKTVAQDEREERREETRR